MPSPLPSSQRVRHPKRILWLGVGMALLCHTPMTQAGIFDPILRVLIPNYQTNSQTDAPTERSQLTDEPIAPSAEQPVNQINQLTSNSIKSALDNDADANADFITNTSQPNQPHDRQEPSLYQLLLAEFAISRGQPNVGLVLYKQQAFKDDASPVFERALQLSLQYEDTLSSLQFAEQWQQNNPEHTPALFYVAHLALQSGEYEAASRTLKQILAYDPKADLSQLLQGIYPADSNDQRRLLTTLQQLNSEENWSLSVLQAGLLLQFDEPELALLHINRALRQNPDNLAVINLKADILKQIASSSEVLAFLQQQQHKLPNAKELYLAQIRYLLELKESEQAWQLLQRTHDRFIDDNELTLLAALVGIDVADYAKAEQLLERLLSDAYYQDQGNYYLAISAERQHLYRRAYDFYAKVSQADLVLDARKKMVAFALLNNQPDTALHIIDALRQEYPQYADEADILQADILHQQGKHDDAKSILATALQTHGDKEAILYAYTQLLDNQRDFALKQRLLTRLMNTYPDDALYVLNLAELLLDKDPNSAQGQQLAQQIADVWVDDPSYDDRHNRRAINLLARSALMQGGHANYAKVIEYLQTPYTVQPSLETGILLLSAYQGLLQSSNQIKNQANTQTISQLNERIDNLLTDLQQKFGYDKTYFANLDSLIPLDP